MKNSHSYNDNGLWHTKWTDIFSKRLQYHQTTICIDIVSDAITYYFTNDITNNIVLHIIFTRTMPLAVT